MYRDKGYLMVVIFVLFIRSNVHNRRDEKCFFFEKSVRSKGRKGKSKRFMKS